MQNYVIPAKMLQMQHGELILEPKKQKQFKWDNKMCPNPAF